MSIYIFSKFSCLPTKVEQCKRGFIDDCPAQTKMEGYFSDKFHESALFLQRTWGRWLKMLFQAAFVMVFFVLLFPWRLYYRFLGVSPSEALRR